MIRRRYPPLYDGTVLKSPLAWSMWWRFWHFGRAYGYPRCCVARFAFDCARGRYPVQLRGSVGDRVPCGVFHRSAS